MASEGGLLRSLLLKLMMPVAMLGIFAFYYCILVMCSGKKSMHVSGSASEAARSTSDIAELNSKPFKCSECGRLLPFNTWACNQCGQGASEESEVVVPIVKSKSKLRMTMTNVRNTTKVMRNKTGLQQKDNSEMRDLYYRHCQAFVHFMMFT
jgi:hypothetical protein